MKTKGTLWLMSAKIWPMVGVFDSINSLPRTSEMYSEMAYTVSSGRMILVMIKFWKDEKGKASFAISFPPSLNALNGLSLKRARDFYPPLLKI